MLIFLIFNIIENKNELVHKFRTKLPEEIEKTFTFNQNEIHNRIKLEICDSFSSIRVSIRISHIIDLK